MQSANTVSMLNRSRSYAAFRLLRDDPTRRGVGDEDVLSYDDPFCVDSAMNKFFKCQANAVKTSDSMNDLKDNLKICNLQLSLDLHWCELGHGIPSDPA